jgi:phosphoribosylanthranilate isomerase
VASKYFIKICGITSVDDAKMCIASGATAIGFNFFRQSKRYIDPAEAKIIADQVRNEIQIVGLFVNEDVNRVKEIAAHVKLTYCQFHGDEAADEVNMFGNAIKAFRVDDSIRNVHFDDYKTSMFLFDAFDEKEYGGTGKSFNWLIAREANEFGKIIVAGGLDSENVAEAISIAQPWGVDVSSGVEREPGKKDLQKVQSFVGNARAAFSML